jgi:hypothetical protein
MDPISTREATFGLKREGIDFRFKWDIEDLMDNIPPFGECDGQVAANLRVRWSVNADGTYSVVLQRVQATDLGVSTSWWCPFHQFGLVFARFFTFWETIAPEREVARGKLELQRAIEHRVQLELGDAWRGVTPSAVYVGTANLRVSDIFIQDNELWTKFNYTVRFQRPRS